MKLNVYSWGITRLHRCKWIKVQSIYKRISKFEYSLFITATIWYTFLTKCVIRGNRNLRQTNLRNSNYYSSLRRRCRFVDSRDQSLDGVIENNPRESRLNVHGGTICGDAFSRFLIAGKRRGRDQEDRSQSGVHRSWDERARDREATRLKPIPRGEPNSARDLLIQGCRVGHYLVSRDPGGKAAHGAVHGATETPLYLSPDISPEPLNTPGTRWQSPSDRNWPPV